MEQTQDAVRLTIRKNNETYFSCRNSIIDFYRAHINLFTK